MIDLAVVGQSIAATIVTIGGLAGGGWAWWLKQQKNVAVTRADVAENNAATSVADAEQAVYNLLVKRLDALETESMAQRQELRDQRGELDAERRHSRALELHMRKLEAMLIAAGLTPPPFPDDSDHNLLPGAARTS
jgi:uncharacterized protein HemX